MLDFCRMACWEIEPLHMLKQHMFRWQVLGMHNTYRGSIIWLQKELFILIKPWASKWHFDSTIHVLYIYSSPSSFYFKQHNSYNELTQSTSLSKWYKTVKKKKKSRLSIFRTCKNKKMDLKFGSKNNPWLFLESFSNV